MIQRIKNFIKKNVVPVAITALLVVLAVFSAGASPNNDSFGNGDGGGFFGRSISDGQWFVIDRFTGYKTKADPAKIDIGANPVGQNTLINDGDRVSIRGFGNTILGTSTTTAEKINTLHTFRKRSGENILIRTRGTYVEWFEEGNDVWEALGSSYTDNKVFGFADYNVNADQHSYTYFGNGSDDFSRWNGAHTLINGALSGGEGTITVDDTGDFAFSGTIIYCGTELAYSAKTATTFTVVSAHACADNKGIAQAVETYASNPKGNIYLNANNRLFVSGIASTTQAVFFSGYGDATDFVGADLVTNSTADSPGIFNLGEGGGGVTGMVLDEEAIYILKKSLIYKATLSDSLYTLTTLKTFDGKSQTTGGVSDKSVFTGGNGVFFITPDKQIMNLGRVAEIDFPQIVPISDTIKPTVQTSKFATSTGIFWQDKAYIAAESQDSTINDVVFVWNQRVQAWESPIIGWSVGDWAIYDDGDGEELYFGDYNQANVYKVTDDAIDNTLGVTANYRTKHINFGLPQNLKEIDNLYVEGYITDGTTLSMSMLLDENGFTQTFKTDFVGTETDYLYDSNEYNVFGLHPFGFKQIGSQVTESKKKFRIYLNKSLKRVPFYTAQLEFASDGVGQYWEITNIGIHYRVHSQPEKSSLYRVFQ